MRSKAPLALMEQLIMVLVFALAAALCLQMFALSDQLSRENEDRDRAALLAQNAAETYKFCRGDQQQVVQRLGGQVSQGLWHCLYDEDLSPVDSPEDAAYSVDVLPEATGVDGLGRATVSVYEADGNQSIFTLTVAWQEEVAQNG